MGSHSVRVLAVNVTLYCLLELRGPCNVGGLSLLLGLRLIILLMNPCSIRFHMLNTQRCYSLAAETLRP